MNGFSYKGSFENLTDNLFSFYAKEYGEISLNDIVTRVSDSKQTKKFFSQVLPLNVRLSALDFVKAVHTNIHFTFAKPEKIALASVILLNLWNKIVGNPKQIADESYLNKTLFDILTRCNGYKINLAGKSTFFERFYHRLADIPDLIEISAEIISDERIEELPSSEYVTRELSHLPKYTHRSPSNFPTIDDIETLREQQRRVTEFYNHLQNPNGGDYIELGYGISGLYIFECTFSEVVAHYGDGYQLLRVDEKMTSISYNDELMFLYQTADELKTILEIRIMPTYSAYFQIEKWKVRLGNPSEVGFQLSAIFKTLEYNNWYTEKSGRQYLLFKGTKFYSRGFKVLLHLTEIRIDGSTSAMVF